MFYHLFNPESNLTVRVKNKKGGENYAVGTGLLLWERSGTVQFLPYPESAFYRQTVQEHHSRGKSALRPALDRMALSLKNNWLDAQGRVYIIFTVADVMETFGCAEQKANKLLNELDSTRGIGLAERVRRGLGLPG